MTTTSAEISGAFPRGERVTIAILAVMTLAMRAVAFFHYRFDSDEPQHLHVAWGWAVGLLQYRDVFDNHAPLFHMAMSPLLRLLGERPDVLLYMRLPMLLLWGVFCFAAFTIALRLYGARIATWSLLLLNVFPPFFLKSLEFRTDNLWNTCWMVAVLMLVDASPDPEQRASRYIHLFLGGVLFGCAFAISLKTSLLLLSLTASAVLTWMTRIRGRKPSPFSRFDLGLVAVGVPIMPVALAAFFISRGIWENLVYCTLRFNGLVSLTRPALAVWTFRLVSIPLLLILIRIAWRKREASTDSRYFFAVTTGIFGILLYCFWILISPRDFLPFMALLALFAVAALARRAHFLKVMLGLSLVSLIATGYYSAWLKNRTREFITMEEQVLQLSRPGEMVMDYKGETIYRRRPYYYILEFITRSAIGHGLIEDTIPEDLVRTRCHIAQADGEQWPDRGRDFLRANYIDLGRLRASGQWLRDHDFTVAVPGDYVVLTRRGEAAGALDGTPYTGPRHLAAGKHTFIPATAGDRLAFLWAPAWARGFSPFHLRGLDF